LEGSDPKLKNEYIVIGSHLDHLGIRGGQVYPGADDNGSGSTAVLSIAKAMAMNAERPKRSVLFIWFAAEEIGLVGSRHYCKNPTKPVEDMICMFNIDMVGRNEETKDETSEENEGHIHLVGSQKGETDLHKLIFEANKSVGFEFEFDEEQRVFSRSDQINFYRLGVPVAFLFGGFHPDYHQPSDQHAKINFKKIAAAAKLYYLAIHLASEHGRFKLKTESVE
jgi:Zn-dependent M28 family amino/carboxypeptidase